MFSTQNQLVVVEYSRVIQDLGTCQILLRRRKEDQIQLCFLVTAQKMTAQSWGGENMHAFIFLLWEGSVLSAAAAASL